MKKILALLFSAALAVSAFAQNAGNGPVTKKTSGATANDINEDLNINTGRIVDVKGGTLRRTGTGVVSLNANLATLSVTNGANLDALGALTATTAGKAFLTYTAASGDLVYWNGAAWTQIASTASGRALLTSTALTATGLGLTNGGTIDSWGGKAVPSGAAVGTTDTQTLTNKSIDGGEINSGTVAIARMPALTGGDATTSAGSGNITLGTVNANTGTWGSATQAAAITLDGKGRATGASNITITPAWSSITGKPTAVDGSTTQSANTVYSGPSSGSAAAPAFRALVEADVQAGGAPLRNALASMQALYFDGIGRVDMKGLPAFGTGDFTLHVAVNRSSISDSSSRTIFGQNNGTNKTLMYAYNAQLILSADGTNDLNSQTTYFDSAGKWVIITYTRTGTTGQWYKNGLPIGSSFTDSTNYTAPINAFGAGGGGGTAALVYQGYMSRPLIFNRALSAAEVLALYESSDAATTDYAVGGPLQTFTLSPSGTGGWTGSITTTTASGSSTGSHGYLNYNGVGGFWKALHRVRVSLNVTAISGGTAIFNQSVGNVNIGSFSTTGVKTFEFTVTADSTAFYIFAPNGISLTYDSLTVTPLGLLCAPESDARGNGFIWNDESGDSAHLFLATSDVAWKKPSKHGNRVRTTSSTNGNQQLGGQVVISANAQIMRVRARAQTNTPTITLGTASGGAQVVASIALSTSWKDLTIALTGGMVGASNTSLWVGSNSTDVIEWDVNWEPLSP